MRWAALLACALGAGCASPGTAEDFQWSIECPKAVDKGAEFLFKVNTLKGGTAVPEVSYRYQIQWPGAETPTVRHGGSSGEAEKTRARLVPGTATLVVTCLNRQDLDVKVLEVAFDVK